MLFYFNKQQYTLIFDHFIKLWLVGKENTKKVISSFNLCSLFYSILVVVMILILIILLSLPLNIKKCKRNYLVDLCSLPYSIFSVVTYLGSECLIKPLACYKKIYKQLSFHLVVVVLVYCFMVIVLCWAFSSREILYRRYMMLFIVSLTFYFSWNPFKIILLFIIY